MRHLLISQGKSMFCRLKGIVLPNNYKKEYIKNLKVPNYIFLIL